MVQNRPKMARDGLKMCKHRPKLAQDGLLGPSKTVLGGLGLSKTCKKKWFDVRFAFYQPVTAHTHVTLAGLLASTPSGTCDLRHRGLSPAFTTSLREDDTEALGLHSRCPCSKIYVCFILLSLPIHTLLIAGLLASSRSSTCDLTHRGLRPAVTMSQLEDVCI